MAGCENSQPAKIRTLRNFFLFLKNKINKFFFMCERLIFFNIYKINNNNNNNNKTIYHKMTK